MLTIQTISPQEYQRFAIFLEAASGIVLGEAKQYLIVSRLAKLMQQHQLSTLNQLLQAMELGQPRPLRDAVIEAMTTNETSWFRDAQPFETLAETVLPALLANRQHGLRIWSAACSTGQEAYTISMILTEYAKKTGQNAARDSQILATDLALSAIQTAKQAEYAEVALNRGLSPQRRDQFFDALPAGGWRVNDEVRQRVSFRQQNLLTGFTLLGKFDVIFCRNVLIYFSAERKKDILQRLALALNKGGYLFLGASETLNGYSDAFELVRTATGSVYRLKR